jgi:two-component system response regulator SaeR
MAKRVLVVEDDVECAEAYRELLNEAGYDVTLAHDGSTGLDLFGKDNYDMAMLDIMMPSGDKLHTDDLGLSTGLEVVKQIRAKTETLPILVISVVWDEETSRSLRSLGVTEVLQKPVRPEALVRTVGQILGGA